VKTASDEVKVKQVFINASSSNSAIGEQRNCLAIQDSDIEMTDVVVENKKVHYFSMQGVPQNKNFDDMVALLSSHLKSVVQQSNLNEQMLNKTMLFLGSTSLDIDAVVPDESKDVWLSQTDRLSRKLVNDFGLHHIHYTFNTACTSSANAMIYAGNMIKQGKISHAIVIGCEFFNQLSMNGFDSLDLISTTSVKPFSTTRDGLILGEGVAAILLADKPNKTTALEWLGGYSSCDDYSLTITDESGSHIADVVEKALNNADICSDDIDLVKIHGTASQKSDLAECNALETLFNKVPELVGFKSFLGHTLGACGILEIAILDYIIQHNIYPNCQYQQNAKEQLLLPFVTSIDSIVNADHMLLNHFGFGGNNAAIILKRVTEEHQKLGGS